MPMPASSLSFGLFLRLLTVVTELPAAKLGYLPKVYSDASRCIAMLVRGLRFGLPVP
jgi:hypothetical protein